MTIYLTGICMLVKPSEQFSCSWCGILQTNPQTFYQSLIFIIKEMSLSGNKPSKIDNF